MNNHKDYINSVILATLLIVVKQPDRNHIRKEVLFWLMLKRVWLALESCAGDDSYWSWWEG